MEFDYQIIEEKLKQLPKEIQRVFISPEIVDTVKNIGDQYNLKIDEEGTLYDLTAYVLLGLIPADQFVSKFSELTKIDSKTSRSIAESINKEVFGPVRNSMQVAQEKADLIEETEDQKVQINTLEKAGGFSVEERTVEHGVPVESHEDNVEHRDDILAGIENPTAGNEKISRKEQSENRYVEPLIDHLLNGSVAQPQQKSSSAPTQTPVSVPTPPPPKRSGPDPYREEAL
ncbi:MAG: hypothetical protein V4481_02375 [Patescibacteria group bacterium]